MITEQALERRLRVAAALVMGGLVVELGSLFWRHPTAFICFFVAGGLLFAVAGAPSSPRRVAASRRPCVVARVWLVGLVWGSAFMAAALAR